MDRDKIIQAIRQNCPTTKQMPKQFMSSGKQSDTQLINDFKDCLKQAGAEVIELDGIDEVARYMVKQYPGATDFSNKAAWNRYSQSCSKENLDKLEIILLNGQFGVAENGAIWLDDTDYPNRLIPFITKQMFIKLDSEQIVGHMHEAYDRISLKNTGFGVFISGPSKTADIEQSLVYGAHGAIEHTILLY